MRRRADYNMVEDNLDVTNCDSYKKPRDSIHCLPTAVSFGLIAVLLGLFGLVYFTDNNLPTPLSVADEKNHPDSFITERARATLKSLTDFGPRIAGGYENENLTVAFLKQEINNIILKAHANQKLELDVQLVSGVHYLNQTPNGKLVPYANLQNVVVKLHSNQTNAGSFLINSHFDSVPTSPGGSDDGINVAIMLEVLRILAKEAAPPRNNIIFLFNGAEETGLQAAHGFITKHKWAKECKVVLNLEAAGAGGKIILFQSGPNAPWLLDYYSQVPYPYGQAAGEEIFQSGIIPSDTDFRIFRDYGGLVGLDMAFMKNGYRYHTKYDDFEHIPLGSFQQAGANTLALVRSLGNAPEVANPTANPGKVVFFDVFGLFMISYGHTVAQIVNYVFVVLSLVVFGLSLHSFSLGYSKQTLKFLALSFGAVLGGWVVAAGFVALSAFIIDKIGYSMSWYANPWLIFGLYVTPTVAVSGSLLSFVVQKNLSHNVTSQIHAHCTKLIWTVILFIGTVLNLRSVYALLIPIMFNTVAFLLIYVLKWQHTVRKWQIIYFISLAIPTTFLMYTTEITLSLFVPMMGRIGPDKNPDLLIGLISVLFTVIITSPFVALVTLVRKSRYLLFFFAAVFVASIIIMFTPLGFPYTGNSNYPAAERYWILHTGRTFHGENATDIKRDSGYFLLNMDRNSPSSVKNHVTAIAKARNIDNDCEQYVICGLPLVHAKIIQILKYSTWIPAGQPELPQPTTLTVNSKVQLSPTAIRYSLSIAGPDRIGVYISPKSGVKITNISLLTKLPSAAERSTWNDRELYVMVYIYGKEAAPLEFTFDVEIPANASDITTEIGISGIHVHDNINRKMPHYQQFLKEFPDWADLTAWLGSYESWWI